jgi:hypothetical protein
MNTRKFQALLLVGVVVVLVVEVVGVVVTVVVVVVGVVVVVDDVAVLLDVLETVVGSDSASPPQLAVIDKANIDTENKQILLYFSLLMTTPFD